MPTSTDINLPKSKLAVFPDSCVNCGMDSPGNTVTIGTSSIGWWTAVTWWFGKRFSAQVPACKRCAFRIQFHRIGAIVVFIVLALLILLIIKPIITPHVPRAIQKWSLMISLLICLSPYFLWEVFFPPAIELTAYADSVDYEFRDEAYATEFDVLNRDLIDTTGEDPGEIEDLSYFDDIAT